MRIERFLATSPLFSLYVAYDQVLRDFQDQLKGEGVHFLQALIVTGLFFEERAVRPSELAGTLRSSRSNVSHALRDLERKGLVARATHEGDARAYAITLTKAGRKRAARLIQIFDSIQDQLEAAGEDGLIPRLRRFTEIYRACQRPGSFSTKEQ